MITASEPDHDDLRAQSPVDERRPEHLRGLTRWYHADVQKSSQIQGLLRVHWPLGYSTPPRLPAHFAHLSRHTTFIYLFAAFPGSTFPEDNIPPDIAEARRSTQACPRCGSFHIHEPQACALKTLEEYDRFLEPYHTFREGDIERKLPGDIGRSMTFCLTSYLSAYPSTRFLYQPTPPTVLHARQKHHLCAHCGIRLSTNHRHAAEHSDNCKVESFGRIQELEANMEMMEECYAH